MKKSQSDKTSPIWKRYRDRINAKLNGQGSEGYEKPWKAKISSSVQMAVLYFVWHEILRVAKFSSSRPQVSFQSNVRYFLTFKLQRRRK